MNRTPNVILYHGIGFQYRTLRNALDSKNISYQELDTYVYPNGIAEMTCYVKIPVMCVDGKNLSYLEARNWIDEQSTGKEGP